MTFKIHYTINGTEDEILISGATIEEVRAQMNVEMTRRGVDQSTCWGEEIIHHP